MMNVIILRLLQKNLKKMKEAKNTPKKELEKSYYKRTKEKLIDYKGG